MKTIFLWFSFLPLIMGCMVGPNYTPPHTPMPPIYNEDRTNNTVPNDNDEALVKWWMIFNDPFLDLLLDEAIHNNLDYRIALEQVCQARSQYWIQFTQILPEFDATSTASRFRSSQSFVNSQTAMTGISPVQSFFQIGFDAIWQIDLFGKLRRSARSAFDLWEATYDEARAVKIIILSEVANTYSTICSFQKKTNLSRQTVSLDKELFVLASSRFEAGLASKQEVDAIRSTLEKDESNLKTNETTLKLTIYSLAVLLGMPPETIIGDFNIQRPIPYAGDKIPVGVPGDLLRRRPDIQSAERQLAAATEEIGVAVAALFPEISLTGSSSSFAANPLQGANIGFSSSKLNKLFDSSSRIWGIGGLVTMPIFDFGKRSAAIDVQTSLAQQAYLNYQKTVIGALQETEQALVAYYNEEEKLQNLNREVKANYEILILTTDLYQSGLADYSQVLQAKELWLVSVNSLTDSEQALATDLIAIYKALGGDW